MSIPKFEGQVALVTGATRGIGAAIALELAQRGLKVIGTGTSAEGAAKITAALAACDGRGCVLDVNDGAAVDALVDEIVKVYGAVHVLVNNAGITRDTLAMRLKDADWDAVLDTNLKAVFRLSRAVIRPMMKQRYGRIISITSVVGASGNAGQANYAAAKAGVAGMTRALARELGSRSITVNCVAPGFIEKLGGIVFTFHYTHAGIQKAVICYFSASKFRTDLQNVDAAPSPRLEIGRPQRSTLDLVRPSWAPV